jgi:hypothetical protein
MLGAVVVGWPGAAQDHLRRQAGRVRYEPADRVWLAALARLIPRNRWAEVFPSDTCDAPRLAPQAGREEV